jgi:hypothetical protein
MKLAHNRAVGLQCASVLVVLIFRFLLPQCKIRQVGR